MGPSKRAFLPNSHARGGAGAGATDARALASFSQLGALALGRRPLQECPRSAPQYGICTLGATKKQTKKKESYTRVKNTPNGNGKVRERLSPNFSARGSSETSPLSFIHLAMARSGTGCWAARSSGGLTEALGAREVVHRDRNRARFGSHRRRGDARPPAPVHDCRRERSRRLDVSTSSSSTTSQHLPTTK